MKRVVPQESQFGGQSPAVEDVQPEVSGGCRRVQTSAAMLGLALSFGASAPLLAEPEHALAAEGPHLTVLPAVSGQADAKALQVMPSPAIGASSYHTVEPGESLWQIAAHHEADIQAIRAANGISSDEVLRVGQVIRVPAVGLENLAEAGSARLALKPGVAGGVGGDMVTVNGSGSLSIAKVPLVDDLEKVWELEASLTAEDELVDEKAISDEEQLVKDLDESSTSSNGALVDVAQVALVPAQTEPETGWSVADSQESAPVSAAPVSLASDRPAVAEQPPEEFTPVASLPLHSEGDRSAVAAPQPLRRESSNASDRKKDLVAVLPPRPVAGQPLSETTTLSSYQVKPGDTLWSIASRNGLTLDELLSHNREVSRPEALTVGDSLSLPATAAEPSVAEAAEPVSLASANTSTVSPSREQVIRDHLARIRESNSAQIDRDQLNARIREARQELSRSSSSESGNAVSLEYHAPESPVAPVGVGGSEPASQTALMVRESAQTASAQWTVTDVSKDEPQQVAVLSPEAEPTTEQPASLEGAAPSSQLLAAAPLGADAYRIAPSLPVGQTVSPSMPMLPGADEFLPEAPRLSNGYIWPTSGTLTSGYGPRWGRMHRGIDIAGPVGTPIVAAAPGVVVRSGWNSGGYGNLVDIRHADGSMTRYAHNSRLFVREGEQVRQGQQIAAMGSTGYSTGPHLHFEVHLASSGTVNPMAYLPSR